MLKLLIRLVYIFVMFIEALVITRIVLLLISANLSNSVASWIMNTSDMFVNPFDGIVTNALKINSIEIPVTSVVALVFYIIAAFILSELLKSFARE